MRISTKAKIIGQRQLNHRETSLVGLAPLKCAAVVQRYGVCDAYSRAGLPVFAVRAYAGHALPSSFRAAPRLARRAKRGGPAWTRTRNQTVMSGEGDPDFPDKVDE